MEYSEEDFLPLSSIMHFAFCQRRWALIHIERQWAENMQTALGRVMHANAHGGTAEKRGDLWITRSLPVFSRALGLRGECDVVEWRASDFGVSVAGRKGLWLPTPVEYKRGSPGEHSEPDAVQLCAQAICLEEMLVCRIDEAFLYYGEPHRRFPVALGSDLRERVSDIALQMHQCYARQHTPRVKPQKRCRSCSLADICLPRMPAPHSVSAYIQQRLGGDDA